MSAGGSSGRFSALLLEGLDHYRKGRMLEAVRAWEEAYLLEPTNLRAREFLRSALERIHAHMGPAANPAVAAAATPAQESVAPRPPPQETLPPRPQPQPVHPWLPAPQIPVPPSEPPPAPSQTQTFAMPPPAVS